MLSFILAEANIPFAIAIGFVLAIGLFEGLGSLLGVGMGSALDSLLPDVPEIPEVNPSSNINVHELGSESSFTRLLGWLRIGRVPLLMVLVVFVLGFGLVGYLLNVVALNSFGLLLPKLITVPLALFAVFPVTRAGTGLLERIMPRDETSSVSLETLVGREARITLGEASAELAAEAKVFDQHGKAHYVMVKAESGEGPFNSHQSLLLVRREGEQFIAILTPEEAP